MFNLVLAIAYFKWKCHIAKIANFWLQYVAILVIFSDFLSLLMSKHVKAATGIVSTPPPKNCPFNIEVYVA